MIKFNEDFSTVMKGFGLVSFFSIFVINRNLRRLCSQKSVCSKIYSRLSQNVCDISVACRTIGRSTCFCRDCESEKHYLTVRCWAHLILPEGYSSDLPLCLKITSLLDPSSSAKFHQPSPYCTVINCTYVGNRSRGWPEGSLFDSYNTNV